jgi:hypothetical protein
MASYMSGDDWKARLSPTRKEIQKVIILVTLGYI